jgi:hypothetical protein
MDLSCNGSVQQAGSKLERIKVPIIIWEHPESTWAYAQTDTGVDVLGLVGRLDPCIGLGLLTVSVKVADQGKFHTLSKT